MTPTPGRFRAALASSTMVMLLWSWPLWLEAAGSTFPRVPFVGGITRPLVPLAIIRFGATITALISAAVGFHPRRAMGVSAGLVAWMVAEDQFRLQPWIYQFLLMGLAVAAVPAGRALGLCRLFLVAQYFHSGLSKLDVTFRQELGLTFLKTATSFLGVSLERWPPAASVAAILVMPVAEIAIALGLVFRPTRIYALAGAILLHLGLIVLLGPRGLGHSTIVLMWNVALIVEVILLFGRAGPADVADRADTKRGTMTRVIFVLAAVLPFGERWGLWDSWPSFALYSSHNERMICEVRGGENPDFDRLDLTGWSLAERRVPAYPQGRVLNGVAEALAARYGGRDSVRVVHLGRADRRTGGRTVAEFAGLEAIRRRGDSYLLNAHPMP